MKHQTIDNNENSPKTVISLLDSDGQEQSVFVEYTGSLLSGISYAEHGGAITLIANYPDGASAKMASRQPALAIVTLSLPSGAEASCSALILKILVRKLGVVGMVEEELCIFTPITNGEVVRRASWLTNGRFEANLYIKRSN